MADIITESIPIPKSTNWANPSNVGGNVSGIPIARITFQLNVNIPSKLAADVNVLLVTMNLPRNFVYRLDNWMVRSWGDSLTAQIDFQKSMGVRVTQNTPGGGALFIYASSDNDTFFHTGSQAIRVYQSQFLWETQWARPVDINRLLIDTSEATADVQLSLIDVSTDATIATQLQFYVTFLQYSVDAVNSWQLNTPTLINGF